MPDSRRSSVDFPAPLCPTSPTRSPIFNVMVMSRSASMTTTLSPVRPIAPPALPKNAFFSERVFASKIGNSTQASRVSMYGSFDKVTAALEVLPGAMTGIAPGAAMPGGRAP